MRHHRTCVHIQPNTRTVLTHWGLPHLWLYRPGPAPVGNPRSHVSEAQPVLTYRLAVEHREEAVEAFGQEWVREDRVCHGGIGELAEHGDLDHGHDLAAFAAEDRAAQDLPAVRVDDGLHEAARLPGLEGPDDGAHRTHRPPDRASSRPGIALGQAQRAELGVDELHGRDDPVPRTR